MISQNSIDIDQILSVLKRRNPFENPTINTIGTTRFAEVVQSFASSLAKHGGALFSAVSWSIKDPIGAPGPYEPQEC